MEPTERVHVEEEKKKAKRARKVFDLKTILSGDLEEHEEEEFEELYGEDAEPTVERVRYMRFGHELCERNFDFYVSADILREEGVEVPTKLSFMAVSAYSEIVALVRAGLAAWSSPKDKSVIFEHAWPVGSDDTKDKFYMSLDEGRALTLCLLSER